jgi:hypothetical protein
MPATKKKSPLEDTQPISKEPDISHSSWLYRLTASNTNNKEKTTEQEIKIEPPQQPESSLWSWLGYPTEKQSTIESFFTRNKASLDESQLDSVIIDEEKQRQEPMKEKKKEINAKNALIQDRKPTVAACRNNAVVPSFPSQFNQFIPTNNNSSLMSKAINSIYSIFASQSNKPSTSSLISEMKQHAETIAGKKIVIIGVHGWFPMKLVRSMIGEPTGTSSKFCEQMSAAVKKYFESTHQLVIPDEAVTSIALQWEGKVLERVEKLYELIMVNWQQTIMEADVILWATHSQGTPVSAILLRKLIEHGLIQIQRQSVCMLAMAGISHGPFPALKGSVLVKVNKTA